MSEISRSIGLCSSSAIAWRPFSASHHLVAFALEHDREQLAHRSLVVDDEDARRDGVATGGGSAASGVDAGVPQPIDAIRRGVLCGCPRR